MDENNIIPLTGDDDSFEHEGVLGQVWGVINSLVGKYYVKKMDHLKSALEREKKKQELN